MKAVDCWGVGGLVWCVVVVVVLWMLEKSVGVMSVVCFLLLMIGAS
jgi:hypothetical protein